MLRNSAAPSQSPHLPATYPVTILDGEKGLVRHIFTFLISVLPLKPGTQNAYQFDHLR